MSLNRAAFSAGAIPQSVFLGLLTQLYWQRAVCTLHINIHAYFKHFGYFLFQNTFFFSPTCVFALRNVWKRWDGQVHKADFCFKSLIYLKEISLASNYSWKVTAIICSPRSLSIGTNLLSASEPSFYWILLAEYWYCCLAYRETFKLTSYISSLSHFLRWGCI